MGRVEQDSRFQDKYIGSEHVAAAADQYRQLEPIYHGLQMKLLDEQLDQDRRWSIMVESSLIQKDMEKIAADFHFVPGGAENQHGLGTIHLHDERRFNAADSPVPIRPGEHVQVINATLGIDYGDGIIIDVFPAIVARAS